MTAYGGMAKVRLDDYREGFIRLKVKKGARWEWVNYPVQAPPYLGAMLRESDQEKDRITTIRAEQKQRMAAEGRKERTNQERQDLRPTPGRWVAQSPTVIQKRDGWWLHLPFEKRVVIQGKAEERRQAEPDLKVGTIDLNAGSAVAAAWEGRRCLGVRTIWHTQENAKREKVLQKVARKQNRSGRSVKGEHSNAGLWRYVARLDSSVAWQVAAAIVMWAVMAGLQVLVFENLRPYRPERGVSWSRRTNRKRSYWLRGQVLRHVRHLALCHGILVVERNPAWTSQACPHCSHLGERFSPDGCGYPSRFRCVHCGWTGDANVVAALNLKQKWDRTFQYPAKQEAAEARRARKGGAAASRDGSPEMVGANVRRPTDAPAA
jgi:transposase